MTRPTIPLSRRALLGGAVLATSTACGLRLESDAPLPGPTASPAPDSAPLEAVRQQLLTAMAAASAETQHSALAAAIQPVHQEQLTRLDATLTGIGASSLPTPSATGAPSATSSASPTASASGPKGARPASPSSETSAGSSSGTPHPSAAPTDWTRAEAAWGGAAMSATLQRVSPHSRPLAMSIAARGVAALPGGSVVPWVPAAGVPSGTHLLDALATVIDALEWMAARRPVEHRDDLSGALKSLYASRSLVEAHDPSAARSLDVPPRRHASEAEAKKTAAQACAVIESRCAETSTRTSSAHDVNGLLLVWATAVTAGALVGRTPGAFPGLAS